MRCDRRRPPVLVASARSPVVRGVNAGHHHRAPPGLPGDGDDHAYDGRRGWRLGGFDDAPAPSPSIPDSRPGRHHPTTGDTTTKGDEMKIVVIGGTGLIGSKLVGKLRVA